MYPSNKFLDKIIKKKLPSVFLLDNVISTWGSPERDTLISLVFTSVSGSDFLSSEGVLSEFDWVLSTTKVVDTVAVPKIAKKPRMVE